MLLFGCRRSLLGETIYWLSDDTWDLRRRLIIVSHSTWCQVMCAYMWRRWLRIAADKSRSLQAASLSLKIKFLHLLLRSRYLNRWGYDIVLYSHRMSTARVNQISVLLLLMHMVLRPMRAVPHIINTQIWWHIVRIIHSYESLLLPTCSGYTTKWLISFLCISRLLHFGGDPRAPDEQILINYSIFAI